MTNVVLSNIFVQIFAIGTVITFLLNHFLEFIDFRARLKNGGKLPAELEEYPAAEAFDRKKLATISAYENAKYFLWIPSSLSEFALTLILVFSGFYPWLFNFVCRYTGFPNGFVSTYFCAFLFFIISGIPSSILSIPFDLIEEFSIEKKFGFSKMTFKLWLMDQIKGLLLSFLMGAILIAAVIAILVIFPKSWWIFVVCLLFVFTLVMQIIYPLVIAPIFNKFTPLEDGELKTKISELMQNLGFKSNGIFVMDASKRSGHSNAYFGGFGKSKRIVLYDTLIKQLNTDELVAVLGHELGHYKLHHIIRRFVVMVPVMFALTYLLFRIAQSTSIYTGFGFAFAAVPVESVQFIGFFLANLVAGSFMELLNPITSASSRRDEFQADAFSAKLTGSPDALISGLIKLNSENLSELLPPKLYVFWNYDHPTLLERIRALKALKIK
ncbi:MAG: M48 family metallopeptidase [Treponema sp.]|nr:M48 family metallopeptidase [Treponema sp.]